MKITKPLNAVAAGLLISGISVTQAETPSKELSSLYAADTDIAIERVLPVPIIQSEQKEIKQTNTEAEQIEFRRAGVVVTTSDADFSYRF